MDASRADLVNTSQPEPQAEVLTLHFWRRNVCLAWHHLVRDRPLAGCLSDIAIEGLVGLSVALQLSTFAVRAVLSGFDAEKFAVRLAAGRRGTAPIALGTVFGGIISRVCRTGS